MFKIFNEYGGNPKNIRRVISHEVDHAIHIPAEDKHSKPLKTIRFEQDHFPTEKECWHWFTKDGEIYMKSDICVKFNNVHEYHK